MYTPSQIMGKGEFLTGPLINPNHLYSGFGKSQYEWIIQRLLHSSQRIGEWVSLTAKDFSDLFPDGGPIFPLNGSQTPEKVANSWLENMASETSLLLKDNGRFRLTEAAIDALGKKYPTKKTD